jgi:hypothetical protein
MPQLVTALAHLLLQLLVLDLLGAYELLQIGERGSIPAVALSAAVIIPSGRTIDQAAAAGDRWSSTVTGRGAWTLLVGTSAERTIEPFYVRLDLGFSVPMPQEQGESQRWQRLGPGLQASLSGGWEAVSHLVVSLTLRFSWEDSLMIEGARIDGSYRIDSGIGLSISYRAAPHWTIQASCDTGLMAHHLGHNSPGGVTTTLGLRYGYF